MLSIWNFVKRNKGKLIFGAAACGGAYIVHQAIQYYQLQQVLQDDLNGASLQARRGYIFESHQQACDGSILDLLPFILNKISKRFDLEKYFDRLKKPGITHEESVAVWNEMKVDAFARIVVSAFALSLLTTALKCQMSVLASQNFSSYQRLKDASLLSRCTEFFNNSNSFVGKEVTNSMQQISLQCIQYFSTEGLVELMDRIYAICVGELLHVDLKKEITFNELEELLLTIKRKIQSIDCRNFSYIILPKQVNQDAFSHPFSGYMEAHLARIMELFESVECKEVVSVLIDQIFTNFLKFTNLHADSSILQFARIIPLITNSFYTLQQKGLSSPIQNILSSSELHNFSLYVYSLPPLIPRSQSFFP